MLPAENRKSYTNKTGVIFCQCGRDSKLSDSVPVLVCASFSLLNLAMAENFISECIREKKDAC